MKSPELRLGSLPPIRISGGTLIAVVLLAVLVYPGLTLTGAFEQSTAIILAVAIGLFMIVSVAVHEMAHTVAALAFGAQVDHIALTLWGGHTQYRGERLRSWHSIVISLAGPASNALLGAALTVAGRWLADGSAGDVFVFFTATLNYALAVFNMLPGLPMDGGRALESVLTVLLRRPLTATRVTAWTGRAIAVAILILPVWRMVTNPGGASILLVFWAVLIAGLLWQGAGSGLQSALLDERVATARLDRFVRRAAVLPGHAPVATVPARIPPEQVLIGDETTGYRRLDPTALAAVPAASRESVPLTAVSIPLATGATLRAPLEGNALITAMLSRPHPVYVAHAADGRVLGTVTSADVNAHLRGR